MNNPLRLTTLILTVSFIGAFFHDLHAQEIKRSVTFRAFNSSDLIDGKINYPKVLADRSLWPLFELTDEQTRDLVALGVDYYENRRRIYSENQARLAAKSISREAAIAIASTSEVDTPVPGDLEHSLRAILLPHQMELVQNFMIQRFLLSSIIEQKNNERVSKRYTSSLAKLLGTTEKEAATVASKLKQVQLGFHDEIRAVLYNEIESSVRLLPRNEQRDLEEILGLNNKRAELLDASNLRSLISRRLAWQKGKKDSISVPRRSTYQFVSRPESSWLEPTEAQTNELKALLSSLQKKEWKANRLVGEKNQQVLRFSFKSGDERGHETQKLYTAASAILLPHQIEELHILDRWRFLNVRPFTMILESFSQSGQVDISKGVQKRIENGYHQILQNSIDRLSRIQEQQHEQFMRQLPKKLQVKLQQIGT